MKFYNDFHFRLVAMCEWETHPIRRTKELKKDDWICMYFKNKLI